MDEIKFETDTLSQSGMNRLSGPRTPAMVRLLLKLGVPDEAMANRILIGIAVLGLIGTFFLYANLFNNA